METFKDDLKFIFEIDEKSRIIFKSIEITPNKSIHFAIRESQKTMFGNLVSTTFDPVAFILKINDEYHYCPLNNEKFDENIVKEFVEKTDYF